MHWRVQMRLYSSLMLRWMSLVSDKKIYICIFVFFTDAEMNVSCSDTKLRICIFYSSPMPRWIILAGDKKKLHSYSSLMSRWMSLASDTEKITFVFFTDVEMDESRRWQKKSQLCFCILHWCQDGWVSQMSTKNSCSYFCIFHCVRVLA